MGALGKLFTWFKDSQADSTRRTRAARAAAWESRSWRDEHAIQREAVTAAVIPSDLQWTGVRYWYVFFYRSGEVPRTAKDRSRPKESFGPFATREDAVAARDKELALYKQPKRQYKIQRLTTDGYTEIWNYER